jgi:hypothetical protein
MVKKAGRKATIKTKLSSEPKPILVHCRLRIPRHKADALMPHLGIAFDCGNAVVRKTKTFVVIEANLEIRTVGDIVEKGVPVLVTERITVAPVPAKELIATTTSCSRAASTRVPIRAIINSIVDLARTLNRK